MPGFRIGEGEVVALLGLAKVEALGEGQVVTLHRRHLCMRRPEKLVVEDLARPRHGEVAL